MSITYRGMTGGIALALSSRGTGTYTSSAVENPDLNFSIITEMVVMVSEISGSPSLVCSLETSTDGVNWTTVSGTTTAALTGAGSVVIRTALINNTDHYRVTSTVSGSGSPTITYQVSVLAPTSS
jgi:hypothetical protein